jgi:hypothetical protein
MPTFLAVLATTCLLAKGLAVGQSTRSTASMTPVIGAVAAKPARLALESLFIVHLFVDGSDRAIGVPGPKTTRLV